MRRRWTSARALVTHIGMLGAVGVCAAAARWQIHRAASGNVLSYAYAVEWPLFAIAAVVMWWQLIHETAPSSDRHQPRPPGRAPTDVPVDDPDLRSYNERLASLSTHGRRKSWRNPRGLP